MKRCLVLTLALILGLATALAQQPPAEQRAKALKLMQEGNVKEAYDLFAQLVLNPQNDPVQVGNDLNNAVQLLNNLNRVPEIDALREKAAQVHAGNWRLLQTVALSYFNDQYHYGFMIAGNFERGNKRGGQGDIFNSYERDRLRALQLMNQALPLAEKEPNGTERAGFYSQLAMMLLGNRGYSAAWRLQYLSDLTKLPDYEAGWGRYQYGYGRGRGYYGGEQASAAPVDEQGEPLFYAVPKEFTAAQNDGERWRYMLMMQKECGPNYKVGADLQYAQFLFNQFDVQTLQQYGYRGGGQDETERQGGIMALHTLGDDETTAQLATGIKRFKLPAEHNHIKLCQQLAAANNAEAIRMLAVIYENRRQYDRAAEQLRHYLEVVKNDGWATQQLQQITGNWGLFENGKVQPAGPGATVNFLFRNGKKVTFVATAIKLDKLIDDLKAHLKSNPKQLDWQTVNLGNLGYRLVWENKTQYLGEKAAEWTLDLDPRPRHFDRRLAVTTPLQKAGAYLLEARMDGGNTSRIIVWLTDTVIARKPLDKGTWYYVADAVSGQPVADLPLEFFGYRQEYINNELNRKVLGRSVNTLTAEFSAKTDANGQCVINNNQLKDLQNYQWLTLARRDGHLAYHGFTGLWWGNYQEVGYDSERIYAITDRPAYRPGQPVKFKVWAAHVRYDQDVMSRYAKAGTVLQINNPKGEKVFEQQYTADDFGGFEGEFVLPKDATLGVYYLSPHWGGGLQFRVEEYKKPEFEVTVEAPTEPVMLGEKIPVKVKAKYYFGAPVTEAKVKVKVQRTDYSASWYPSARWDWFYGPGYWWYAYDYAWYPGWYSWGCRRPIAWWWRQPPVQPELVMERETPIGRDGKIELTLDTLPAKELHGDTDHRYEVAAEITDQSRRTIMGTGQVLVARAPFKVYVSIDRGYYQVGETIQASFNAQTLDSRPVPGKGTLKLFKVSYGQNQVATEQAVRTWDLPTGDEGRAEQKITASEPGQYRLSYTVTDAKQHVIEGGYVFVIRGQGFDGKDFRFSKIELIPEKREYKPGEKVKLMINTDRRDAVVQLFLRPANNAYLPPRPLALQGKSAVQELEVTKADMPNFFLEALTIYDGQVYTDTKEIVVPPEQRVLNVAVTPSKDTYKPGEKAKVKIQLTDFFGEPFVGSAAMTMYDKALEYISGGSNVPEIRDFFWKWRRSHYPQTMSNLDLAFGNLLRQNEAGMGFIGAFGASVADGEGMAQQAAMGKGGGGRGGNRAMTFARKSAAAPGAAGGMEMEEKAMDAAPLAAAAAFDRADSREMNGASDKSKRLRDEAGAAGEGGGASEFAPVTVRTNFADSAFWNGQITTDAHGAAEIELTMPENLTGWKVRTWAIGQGARVGEGTVEVVTTKNLLLRLQAPRFFVEKDEVVLSANVHNYLKTDKDVKVVLEVSDHLQAMQKNLEQVVKIPSQGEKRVDWRVQVAHEGEAVVRMKALSDEESDAMEMRFPTKVHGMLKTVSFSGHLRTDKPSAFIAFNVPKERRVNESLLEVRYSPTLAGAMVDALPYLISYPYGCTEQTLNKFVPTVLVQKILLDMGLDLKDIAKKQTNLNAQEIGDDKLRAAQWAKQENVVGYDEHGDPIWSRNPVFDADKMREMVQFGVTRLTNMQCSDGGWGWFSGWGEHSWPHTTAVVVHGLQVARDNDAPVPAPVLARGVEWLKRHQAEQVRLIKNAPTKAQPWKEHADDLDALVYLVLVDEKADNPEMREFLYRDRNGLAVYGKCMAGMAFFKVKDIEKTAMIRRNIEQFLVKDEENQTAWLNLGNDGYWWYWYGSEYEAQAYYLKLLARTDPQNPMAPWLVKYLLNNRRHATYWNSTRDTAVCLEAFADYLRASKEDKPDMTLEVWLDGRKQKEVKINKDNLFAFDNKFILMGDGVDTGEHRLEFRRQGQGPLYFNAYLTYFSLEDYITRAGLEVKVNRKYFKLTPEEKTVKVAGGRGQALDQKVEKYKRTELPNLGKLDSGDLVEIELTMESKNDYEYLVFEDMKAAGFEPFEVRSGYTQGGLGAYMELRDDRVSFFVRWMARGTHSLAYRMRAEIPGVFSALPTKASAMYAPELKGNSDEIKLQIQDAEPKLLTQAPKD